MKPSEWIAKKVREDDVYQMAQRDFEDPVAFINLKQHLEVKFIIECLDQIKKNLED